MAQTSKEQSPFEKAVDLVVSFPLYVFSWLNKAAKGVVKQIYNLNPTLNENLDKEVNYGKATTKAQFLENVKTYVKDHDVLKRFFKDEDYITQLAKKAADLKNDPSTCLGSDDLLPQTIKVSLHQQVLYCDDSSSMQRDNRWDSQKRLVERITKITTRILPEYEGVALHFINQHVSDSTNLTYEKIKGILETSSYDPNGNTEIGTYLKSKILEPLVYSKLETKSLKRPLLISVITDGMPEPEKKSEFVDAILECANKLENAGYPRQSVKFMVGQVGTAKSAENFLDTIRSNTKIADLVYCTLDKMDAKLEELSKEDLNLERWLIETLFSAIMSREDKNDQVNSKGNGNGNGNGNGDNQDD